MKRYLAFCGDVYYPSGGMDDYVGDYDTIEEAEVEIKKAHEIFSTSDYRWYHIWDSEEREKVVEHLTNTEDGEIQE